MTQTATVNGSQIRFICRVVDMGSRLPAPGLRSISTVASSSLAAISVVAWTIAIWAGCPGCASRTAAALDLRPGIARSDVRARLRRSDYCRVPAPRANTETYRQCDRPGAHLVYSWIVAEYRRDALLHATRMERHGDPDRAAARWNDLVNQRVERHGPPSRLARTDLLQVCTLPTNTLSWAAWYTTDFGVLIAVYLVRPQSTDDPEIIEEIRLAPTDTDTETKNSP